MKLQIKHYSLYFTEAQLETAIKEREKQEHLQAAWQWLKAAEGELLFERKSKERDAEPERVFKTRLSPVGQAIEAAFRYRFLGDEAEGVNAWDYLQSSLGEQANPFGTISEAVAAAHLAEMLHPFVSQVWRKEYAEFTTDLLAGEATPLEKLWLITLSIVSGIVLEDETRIEAGAEQFRKAVDEQIHPEGYIKPLVVEAKEAPPVFREMLLGLGALSLAAEAGEHLGLKLWNYERRDVGLNTAASYLVYYYFYPEKWRWGTGLTEADTQAHFHEYGAFMEMLTSHVNPRGVELLLEECRPFFSPLLGGLTTLSHSKTEKRKRGFFG
jgi:hypothetical protein